MFKADHTQQTIEVSIPAAKIQEWRQAAVTILQRTWTSRKTIQRVGGKLSWAAGVILQAKPYVQMLYAALNVSKQVVYAKQLKHALTWLVAPFHGFNNGFHRRVQARVRHQVCLEFLVDASPWGGGAVRLVNGCPVECFCMTWHETDEKAIGACIGQAASQAQWEAYMALRALWKWLTPDREGQVKIRSDAAGVLQSFVKRSRKSASLTRIVREVTLHLALTHRSLEAIHLWSEDNAWADALSRLADPREPASVPPDLRHLPLHRQGPVLWRYAPAVRANALAGRTAVCAVLLTVWVDPKSSRLGFNWGSNDPRIPGMLVCFLRVFAESRASWLPSLLVRKRATCSVRPPCFWFRPLSV